MSTANNFKSPLQKAVVTWLAAHPEVTLGELARRAEIDKGDLSRISSGQQHSLNVGSAGRVARAMGTSVEGLLGIAPPQANEANGVRHFSAECTRAIAAELHVETEDRSPPNEITAHDKDQHR